MLTRDGTRKPNRAPGFDYRSPGPYFITICVEDRRCFFGSVVDASMRLNAAGTMVADVWTAMSRQFTSTEFEDAVVMPNHMHALLTLPSDESIALGTIVQAFKRLSTNRYVTGVREQDWPRFDGRLWQRSFHDHIVRNERDMNRLREYIAANPARWGEDRYHAPV